MDGTQTHGSLLEFTSMNSKYKFATLLLLCSNVAAQVRHRQQILF